MLMMQGTTFTIKNLGTNCMTAIQTLVLQLLPDMQQHASVHSNLGLGVAWQHLAVW